MTGLVGKPNTLMSVVVILYRAGYVFEERYEDDYYWLFDLTNGHEFAPEFVDGVCIAKNDVIGFDFEPIALGVGEYRALMCPIYNELTEVGAEPIIKSLFDDVVVEVERHRKTIEVRERGKHPKQPVRAWEIAIITAWEYTCFQCNAYFDPPEWDCAWEYHGIVNLFQTSEKE
jgi:hypothetical protein